MDGKMQYGHDTEDPNKPRTKDVLIFENVDFASMLLPPHIVEGLYSANFRRPSPIQLKAVPLARCGFDLIVQAKSGTGKTLVFGITALDVVKTELMAVQVLIIAPTREIALQIKDVISVIGSNVKGLQVKSFIGGLDVKKDKKDAGNCHIAVVTPGRAKQLLETKVLAVDNLRLLVLDEADKLMESCFTRDLNQILKSASVSKQIILASATLCDSINKFIEKHMNEPMRVTATGVKLLSDSEIDVPKVLLGVKQFVGQVQAPANIAQQIRKKADTLLEVLKKVPFNQCVVFSNFQTRAESICNMLTAGGWPAVSICGKQEQTQRIAAIAAFKEFRCRVLLSTDLTARGLDVHGVSLVVNLDVPYNAATYLHRMGRAGRYGSSGIVVSLVATNDEMKKFQNILFEIGGATMAVYKLPTNLTELNDTDSLRTVVALPPEDVNANVENDEENVTSTATSKVDSVDDKKTNGTIEQQSSTCNGMERLCNALLETYLEPKPAFEFRSYEDLGSSRKSWLLRGASKPAILKSKKDNNLWKYASEIPVTDEEPAEVDETVLKTVLEKNWTDESTVSTEVDASSDSEPSDSEPSDSEPSESEPSESEPSESEPSESEPSDSEPSESKPSSTQKNPVAEVRRLKRPYRKTVTVNLPESARRSLASSGSTRGRRSSFGSSGRCCNHNCENTQWNGNGDYQTQYSEQCFNPTGYFSSLYPNRHQGYSDENSQWYCNWENQLNDIRFYVEYMEYWKNSYLNLYSNPSQNT